ncbi:MAG: winged helix-turn-helix domain-containing protein, partial [Myxococcota bacterium]
MAVDEHGTLVLPSCVVDLGRRRVVRDGSTVALTTLEGKLLAYLVAREGEDVSRDELLRAVWGHAATTSSRAVDYTVFRLRAKLGEPAVPNHLLTAHGHGYRFVRGGDPVHGPTDAPDPGTASAVLPTRQVPLPGGVLDLARGRFDRPDSSAVALSKLEVDVLGVLVAAAGQTVPREAVIAAGWGRGSHDASLDALIRRLRVRLDDPDGTWLVTVRGRGLRLDVGPPRVRTELRDPSTPFEPRPELDRLLASTERLVTIRGTAGIGKTRLAVEAGLRWLADDPDVEVWFCD